MSWRKQACVVGSLIALLGSGCGDRESDTAPIKAELERVQAENAALRRELDELKTTPAALLAEVRVSLETRRIADARGAAKRLGERHPGSLEREEAVKAIAAFDARVEAERVTEEARKKKEVEAEAKRVAAATARMVKSRDSIKGITWYKDRSSEPPITVDNYKQPRNRFYIYFGVTDGGGAPWLRFRTQYYADDWLFVKNFIIAADEARFDSGPVDFETDHGSGDIWEWYDTNLDAQELRWVRAVIASKSATIRFEGRQYYNDKKITPTQKAALQNVLDAFVAMGGQLPE